MNFTYGFRIVGNCSETRRLVDSAVALAVHAQCDPKAEVERECYLSAFTFGDSFRTHLESTGSTKGFEGNCFALWLWFDIDRADLTDALADARRLAAFMVARYALDEAELWLFFSGAKGFHVGLPTSIWAPTGGPDFHRVARRFCEGIAEAAGVVIDSGVYDKVRAFRAPNSRHPKTGLHKRPLTYDELLELKWEAIVEMAREPLAVEVPIATTHSERATDHWAKAQSTVNAESQQQRERSPISGSPRLNRATLDFIRNGTGEGDRHRLLFSAAANLAEFGCPAELAHALLMESALDSGLTPKDTHRQIECGLAAKGGNP